MERIETLEPQTGQASAQATEPKGNEQNNFTDEEKALATKYQVEPKLCRLIAEIVCEQTEDVQGLQQLLNKLKDRQASAQTTEPEVERLENIRLQSIRLHNCVVAILQAVGNDYPVECRPEILTAALKKATKSKFAAERLADMEQEIRRAIDGLLDSKAKAAIALLSELSGLSGISNVGLDYSTDILHSTFSQKDVEQANKEFPDDSNVAFLSMAFGLVRSATEAENESKISYLSKATTEEDC